MEISVLYLIPVALGAFAWGMWVGMWAMRREVARIHRAMRATVASLAERCHGQSELLGQRAEKG